MNSLPEVKNVCVSVLQRETRNSRPVWPLIQDMDMETSKAFLSTTSTRISVVAGTFKLFIEKALLKDFA